MSARHLEVLDLDAPVPFGLTELGEVALAVSRGRPVTLTAAEAAQALRRTKSYVGTLARQGELDGVKVDEQWLIDGASVVAYEQEHPHRLAGLQRARERAALVAVPARRTAPEPRHLVADEDEVGPNLLRERVPAAPLLRQIELASLAGRMASLDEQEQKAIERARHEGTLTIRAADQLAVRLLGLTLWDLYDL
ncbi:helix-turn-helix domain-containing protein [Nocardioides antri]|uniref:Helix-turn-helix domain-containing protein n=1 Tax=Nocardioides antri TaxID=2607659 RepID=A0A5B1M3W2_9ACTN|nr:helix-turn-helix domain-containing protein [Nocardioides antri]KAA1426457.1 helix-turn-helix domain-containing protein [Nocardioides antri]